MLSFLQKTIRIRYVWTHKDKILRFQKYPDTCGRGLRRSRIYKHCYPRLVMRFRNWDDRKLYTGWCMVKKQLYYDSSKTKFIKSEYLPKHCFSSRDFWSAINVRRKKIQRTCVFQPGEEWKTSKDLRSLQRKSQFRFVLEWFYLTLSSSAKTGQSYICESQRRSGYQGSESIAANKASFRSSQFDWIFGFTFAVAIPISQRAS